MFESVFIELASLEIIPLNLINSTFAQNFHAVESSQVFSQTLSLALDPYNETNQLASFEEQETNVDEAPNLETDDRDRANTTYVQMNPSHTTSLNSFGEANAETADAEPGPPVPVRTTSDRRQSGLVSPQSTNSDEEEYVNPQDVRSSVYYANQAAIDGDLSGRQEPVANEVPSNELEDDTEQQLYEDMSGGLETSSPAIPPRGVLCAEPELEVFDSSPQRHDTMDNQYVVMRPLKEKRSSKLVEQHPYVNVPSSQDARLRSVTCPTAKLLAQDESQPTYYNVVKNGSGATKHEEMYSSVS